MLIQLSRSPLGTVSGHHNWRRGEGELRRALRAGAKSGRKQNQSSKLGMVESWSPFDCQSKYSLLQTIPDEKYYGRLPENLVNPKRKLLFHFLVLYIWSPNFGLILSNCSDCSNKMLLSVPSLGAVSVKRTNEIDYWIVNWQLVTEMFNLNQEEIKFILFPRLSVLFVSVVITGDVSNWKYWSFDLNPRVLYRIIYTVDSTVFFKKTSSDYRWPGIHTAKTIEHNWRLLMHL